jgi:hypothetical protein
MNKITEFKTELKALLKKYNASISCNIEGDTHGLRYEMFVDLDKADKRKNYKLTDDNRINARDL